MFPVFACSESVRRITALRAQETLESESRQRGRSAALGKPHLRRVASHVSNAQKGRAREATEDIVVKTIGRRTLLLALALTSALSPSLAASLFGGIDTDNDGTISLDEAKEIGRAHV